MASDAAKKEVQLLASPGIDILIFLLKYKQGLQILSCAPLQTPSFLDYPGFYPQVDNSNKCLLFFMQIKDKDNNSV